MEKLNELARNDSDLDDESDLDDSLKEINCTQDEFINLNSGKRVLPDLLSTHLLDQSQSHEVLFNLLSFLFFFMFFSLVSRSSSKCTTKNNIDFNFTK